MKREKRWLYSSLIITTYVVYIIARTIYYLINNKTYGDVYFEFMFYPHLIFMLAGLILNYILYFKNNKYIKYTMILCYIIGVIFLFINK